MGPPHVFTFNTICSRASNITLSRISFEKFPMLPLRELHAAPQHPTHARYVTARRSLRLTVARAPSREVQQRFCITRPPMFQKKKQVMSGM
jgi:hypothetical protein